MRVVHWWVCCMLGMLPVEADAQVPGFFSNALSPLDSALADCLSATENPASLAFNSNVEVGAFGGRYLQVHGLNFLSAGIKGSFAGTGAGIQLIHTGTSGFQENTLVTALGKPLGAFLVGGSFRFRLISIPGISSETEIGTRIAFILKKDPVTFGASLVGSGFFQKSSKTNSIHSLSAAGQVLWHVSPQLWLGGGLEKAENLPTLKQMAIFYFTEGFQFRLLADLGREQYSLQASWSRLFLIFRIMMGYQPNLGPANGLSTFYRMTR